jgi:CHAD domain-containing protein
MQPLLFIAADERAPQRLRRKALDTADSLVDTLDGVAKGEAHAIHDARRRLKELRALTLLLRLGKDERRFFRDAGRMLSVVRDNKAIVEGFGRLRERFASEWKPRQYQKIERALKAGLDATVNQESLDNLRIALTIERGRIAAWPVDEMHRDALINALAQSYRRARRGMRRAFEERTAKAMHSWRRRVKMHWYNAQFLTEVNVLPSDTDVETLRQLQRTLGQHHDLVLIDEICARSPELLGSERYVRRFQTFVARALAEHFVEAERIGGVLLAQSTRQWILTAAPRIRIGPKKSPLRLPRVSTSSANAG